MSYILGNRRLRLCIQNGYDDFEESQVARTESGDFLVHAAFIPNEWLISFILSYGEHALTNLGTQFMRATISVNFRTLVPIINIREQKNLLRAKHKKIRTDYSEEIRNSLDKVLFEKFIELSVEFRGVHCQHIFKAFGGSVQGYGGRQPGAQCNDQSHKQQHPTKTDRKAPPSEREII